MINILAEEPYITLVNNEVLEKAAQAVLLGYSDPPDCDLSLVIDGDERLQELNREFLGIDAPTDVLSFPSGEEAPDPDTNQIYLGDIIISYPRAAEQAAASADTVTDELQLLVVHGVLHLLGFDHGEADEKKVMWDAQQDILTSLGVQLKRLPE
jgi:probable rRNA maturation factor